jgi:hypothetical protein
MKSNFRVMVAISSLALAALACQAVMGGAETETPPTDVVIDSTPEPLNTEQPSSTEESLSTETEESINNSDVLFDDDFREGRSEWGTGTDADSSVEYVNGALNIQLFSPDYIVWTYPNETNYQNIHMEVTVINNGSDEDAAFGFFCYKQYPIDDSRYYFAVTPGGEYAIARAALAVDDEILTNNSLWETSDLIPKDAASYRLGADCGNGTLTLYVDGQEIDSVSDSTYTSGSFALFAWSGEEVNTVNFSFDDFVMTELP